MVSIIVLRIFVFKPTIPSMSTKDQITEILLATGRSGMEQVVAFMESSGYFVKPGGGHHKEEGGLAQHCLEVYRIMKSTSLSLPADGIVVSAFFHDLGKVNRRFGRGGHAKRSLLMLDHLGFQLTEDERFAIGHHHDNRNLSAFRSPLRRSLSFADSMSTLQWKLRHPRRKS